MPSAPNPPGADCAPKPPDEAPPPKRPPPYDVVIKIELIVYSMYFVL